MMHKPESYPGRKDTATLVLFHTGRWHSDTIRDALAPENRREAKSSERLT